MTRLLRRLVLSMLIPYLWQRWRQRSTSQGAATPTTAAQELAPRGSS